MNTTTQSPTVQPNERATDVRDNDLRVEADFDDRVGMSTPATTHDAEVIADADVTEPSKSADQPTESWQRIQAKFVDDPRKAVAEAHQLVGEVVQRIVDGFTRERSDLERQWSKGDSVSTEDLRMCLQRYRAFFSRLSPAADSHT
jgi:hypothetical protein